MEIVSGKGWTPEAQEAFEKWRQEQSNENFNMLFEQIKESIGNDHLAELWRGCFLFCVEQLQRLSQAHDVEITSDIYAMIPARCMQMSRRWSEELFKEVEGVANLLDKATHWRDKDLP